MVSKAEAGGAFGRGRVPVVTPEEMRRLDQRAIEHYGLPAAVLMESAGRAVADRIRARWPVPGGVLVCAGPGHNGADGVVVARTLMGTSWRPRIAVFARPDGIAPLLASQLETARRLQIPIEFVAPDAAASQVRAGMDAWLSGQDLVVDAWFGTGLARAVAGAVAVAMEAVAASGRPVVAVDHPSGIDGERGAIQGTALAADLTVSFQWAKMGQLCPPGRSYAGTLDVVDIGIPPAALDAVAPRAEWLGPEAMAGWLPPRALDAHKGDFGHLWIWAGHPAAPGAAHLVANAALRSGVGLATLAADAKTLARLTPGLREAMGADLGAAPVTAATCAAALGRATALAIGPSLSPDPALRAVLSQWLGSLRRPVVLDAGALTALGADIDWLAQRTAGTVLTPHPGEAGRMLGLDSAAVQADRVRAARTLAERSGAEVVLKGAGTIIASPDGAVSFVTVGNPGLATAGAGDVLTGVIGSLLAQGLSAPQAARLGAWVHGAAADRAVVYTGPAGLTAQDVIGALGPVLASMSDAAEARS